MSSSGFKFSNPTYTADNFFTYSAGDLAGDSKLQAQQVLEPFPAPRVSPPVFDLNTVLPADAIAAIESSGSLVFHTVGDTGGIVRAEPQLAVADGMATDLAGKTYANGLPAFFFHLGDVVYYFGQEQYYPEQFYDPYRNYGAPIFAIAGNHDGVMFAKEPIAYSLQPFIENFCTPTPIEAAPSFARTTMTQPGVYFVMTAPFTRIIGLYSNTGESVGVLGNAQIGESQVNFLTAQLTAALAARKADPQNKNPQALILAVHHPPFTGSSQHFPSAAMLKQIDTCCTQAGIWPDLVLSGHAHLYERYTRTMNADGRQIPYVVAGNGGYYNLSKMKTTANGTAPTPGKQTEPDGQGNTLSFDQFNDTYFGFLRITVSTAAILVESLGVNVTTPTAAPALLDSFIVDLKAHTVATGSAKAKPAAGGKKKSAKKTAPPKKSRKTPAPKRKR